MELKGYEFKHRGLHKNVPENSLLAFKKALYRNMPIELDVRITKDSKLVVFHDANLKRMTGIDKKIEKCNYEEIENIKLNNSDEKIPLLIDVLNLINNKVLLLLLISINNQTFLFIIFITLIINIIFSSELFNLISFISF